MKRGRAIPLAAGGVAAALALAACSSSRAGPEGTSAGYNAALGAVVNPSSRAGGTIVFDNSSGVPDSTDPGNTYYANMWNIVRLYGRALVTYKSAPGTAGMRLVPDLATSLGRVSDNGLTWTYHLKPGIKFEDGSTVTSRDVKYAVERTYAKDVLPNGPSYFTALLTDPGYPGPTRTRRPAGWA
jgi:peptide/nickel transport system substrate-binding protein